jgi:hypothetical protein
MTIRLQGSALRRWLAYNREEIAESLSFALLMFDLFLWLYILNTLAEFHGY